MRFGCDPISAEGFSPLHRPLFFPGNYTKRHHLGSKVTWQKDGSQVQGQRLIEDLVMFSSVQQGYSQVPCLKMSSGSRVRGCQGFGESQELPKEATGETSSDPETAADKLRVLLPGHGHRSCSAKRLTTGSAIAKVKYDAALRISRRSALQSRDDASAGADIRK